MSLHTLWLHSIYPKVEDLSLLIFSLFLLTGRVVGQRTSTPIEITGDDIEEILTAHNLFRGMVEPPASNMREIKWSGQLARVAQNYARLCMFSPNPNRMVQASGPSFNDTVGENRAFGRTTNYTDLIERGWFVQRSNFNFSRNICLSPGACDEYTQLVWAETDLVGCGAANCPDVMGLPILLNVVVFVCNYAPEGNVAGERPYRVGEPCSNCPPGLPLCVNNTLCSFAENAATTTTFTTEAPVTSTIPETTIPTSATTVMTSTPPTNINDDGDDDVDDDDDDDDDDNESDDDNK